MHSVRGATLDGVFDKTKFGRISAKDAIGNHTQSRQRYSATLRLVSTRLHDGNDYHNNNNSRVCNDAGEVLAERRSRLPDEIDFLNLGSVNMCYTGVLGAPTNGAGCVSQLTSFEARRTSPDPIAIVCRMCCTHRNLARGCVQTLATRTEKLKPEVEVQFQLTFPERRNKQAINNYS